jgi:ABC-type phosphate transport system permease subunit
MIPLIKGFRANTTIKAFILASLVSATSAVVAIETRREFDDTKSSLYITVNEWFPGKKLGLVAIIFFVFVTTFLTSFLVYNLLHLLFAYGSAMIIDKQYNKALPRYY